MASTAALFIVNEDGEATGRVYHFCGLWCRDRFQQMEDETSVYGQSDDYIQGTVCDYCGDTLERELES